MKNLTAIPGVPPLIACLCLLVVWELGARLIGLDSLPTALETLRDLPAILTDRQSLYDILSSIRRMAIGFALAFVFAVPIGLMMGRSTKVAAFFNPLFMMVYPVPKAALMPIIMLWLGIGEASKTLVIFLGVSLPLIYHTYQGAGGRREARVVRRRHGHECARAAAAYRAAGGVAGDHGRVPHRAGAGADHHGDERDDRAAGGDRQPVVQLARPRAIQHGLRHHRDRRGGDDADIATAPAAAGSGSSRSPAPTGGGWRSCRTDRDLVHLVGVGLGIAAAGSPAIGALLRPMVRVLAPVPKIALYPAFILTLGFDHSSKIALVFADALFPILLATYQGAISVEPKLVWSARAMGVGRLKCLFTVVLTAALPSILTGCRISLVISCIVVFLSEMISSTDGLGQLLVRAARNFQTVDMFVPIIAISVLGLILNAGFNLLRAWLLKGFPEEN